MDEVDGIIIRTLKAIHCDFEDEIENLGCFTAEMVVEAAAQCISLIDSSVEVQRKLPPNMAARYRIGTTLAEAIKSFGYQGEVGYHTFLYSNVTEIRRLFLFLISKLPKVQLELQKESFSPQAILKRSVREAIIKAFNKPWVPPYFTKGLPNRKFNALALLVAPTQKFLKASDDKRQKYYSHHLPILSNQLQDRYDRCASVLEIDSLNLAAEDNDIKVLTETDPQEVTSKKAEISRKLVHEVSNLDKIKKVKLSVSSPAMLLSRKLTISSSEATTIQEDEEETQKPLSHRDEIKEGKERMEELEEKVKSLMLLVEEAEEDVLQKSDRFEQVLGRVKVVSEENEKKKESVDVNRKMMELMPQADENIRKLQTMTQNGAARLEKLALQWEKHKKESSEQLGRLSSEAENNKDESRRLLEEVHDTKMKIKELTLQAGEKDSIYKQLLSDFEKMSGGVGRAAYTLRILEIVANIKKQNDEIDKVIEGTKSTQKEINQLSGTVERTFIDADELIFRSAKKDESARKAYKLLASLHENCSTLVKLVEETGSMLKEVRDLEEQIDQENSVKVSESLEKITTDYQHIKQENQALLLEIKAKTRS